MMKKKRRRRRRRRRRQGWWWWWWWWWWRWRRWIRSRSRSRGSGSTRRSITHWSLNPPFVVPDLTDRTPIGRSGTPDLNWHDHDQPDLLPTPPLRTLPDQPDHRCLISPVSLFHHSRPLVTRLKCQIGKKSQEKTVLGNLEQAISEGFWTLSGFACSGLSRCGLEGRSPLKQTMPP